MKKIAGLLLTSLLLIPAVQAEETVHMVAKGETLYSLSKRYGVSMDMIKQWNQTSSDQLKIGQKLRISSEAPTQVNQPTLISQNPVVFKRPEVMISADFLNMRESNDLKAKVIRILTQGMVVQLLESDEFWSKIQLDGSIGYVATPFLQPIESNVKASRSAELSESRLQNVVSSLIGIPYQFGGTSPEGFDCSGFTKYVMEQLGVKLPRTSEEQFLVGTSVEQEDLQVGDLLFFDSYELGKITHVSIYIGNNKIVHSASEAVVVDDATWFLEHYPYYGAKRVLEMP